MKFSSFNQESDRYFNNADSFAMAFDDAWRNYSSKNDVGLKNKEEKLRNILNELKMHPFLKSSPKEAKQIARFRLRLLKLE